MAGRSSNVFIWLDGNHGQRFKVPLKAPACLDLGFILRCLDVGIGMSPSHHGPSGILGGIQIRIWLRGVPPDSGSDLQEVLLNRGGCGHG